MRKRSTKKLVSVVGIDLGGERSQVCMLDGGGKIILEKKIRTSEPGLKGILGKLPRCRVVLEAGAMARWGSSVVESLGHEVKVVNARKMRRIYENDSKSDVVDARELADAGLYRWNKLPTVKMRDVRVQENLAVLGTRDALVRARTALVNTARSLLKEEGLRVARCSVEAFPSKAAPVVPDGLKMAVDPLLAEIASLTDRVKELDKWGTQAGEKDPAIKALQQVKGVGVVTAAAFVWTLDDPHRFAKSRVVGSYLGLRPKQDQSGETDKQMPITKAGNPFLRRLLVGCSHYILGPFGPDTALRRWGLKLAERGGKRARRKAVVAVARKLAVLLHHLWVTGEVYEPLPRHPMRQAA